MSGHDAPAPIAGGGVGVVSAQSNLGPVAIVDDDAGVRGSLDSLMRSAGLVPRSYAGGASLLADPAHGALACIVTDLHMPDMTGLELQAEIVRRGWRQPVILMSAFPTDAVCRQAIEAGVVAFLTKPIDPDALLEAIERATA
jgi:FixJ family two-component response regulator